LRHLIIKETLENLVGTKREDGPEQWRKLHTGASWFLFTTNYYSDDKPSKRWAGNVECMVQITNTQRILAAKPERRQLDDPDVEGRIK
jgi:hypothetical protein